MHDFLAIKRVFLALGVVVLLSLSVWFSAGSPTSGTTSAGNEWLTADQPTTANTDKAELAARMWPMYGGTPQRNMVNTTERNLPAEWDVKTNKNIKWTAELGSQSYGNPVIAGGKIFLGTNNGAPKNPAIQGDKGIIMCLREADGKFLWQAVHDKLEAGRVNDWPEQGICSSPFIDGNRLFYVSNRCELICADTEGMADGNQGVQDEKYKGPTDADIIWRLDMMKELGVFPHNLAVCSPVVVGELVFVVTGNGHDESHENIPAPQAPSFLAVNKKDGRVVWKDSSPGNKILHGQWSNPTYAVIQGMQQTIFPGGDGWLYSFNPVSGKLIWKFDCNPKASKYILGGRGTRNEIIGTPVVHDDRLYVNVGQDPEHGDGVGHLWCIDPTKASATNVDLSPVKDNFDPKAPENKNSGLVWHYGGKDSNGELLWHRSISSCAIKDGLCYIANLPGFIACFDAKTGEKYWEHDALSEIWGSPYVVDGKVYVGNSDGDVLVFQEGKEKKLLATNNLKAPVQSTPVAVNGILYVMTRNRLYAIANK